MHCSNTRKGAIFLSTLVATSLLLFARPAHSVQASRYAHTAFSRRALQQVQPDNDDPTLNNELNERDSEHLADVAMEQQAVRDAAQVNANQDQQEHDDLSDVDAQIQEIAKRVGITEEELKQADVLQPDTKASTQDDATDMDHHDLLEQQRTNEQVPPPPEDDPRQLAQAPPEMVAPGQPVLRRPKTPQHNAEPPRSNTQEKPDSPELVAQLETYKQRLNDVMESEQTARDNERDAKLEAGQLKKQLQSLRNEKEKVQQLVSERDIDLSKLRESLPQIVREAKEEKRGEIEEMKETIEEQKRAFDELFEEKQMLSKMLTDEQVKLDELQEKIQHPDLGLWISQRAEKAAILVEGPEADAIKYYANKYMAPKVTKMKHRLQMLENRVERTVDHLLPAKYGSIVAMLLSVALVGFPIFVTLSTVVSLTKGVSLRQYVLVGNVFLTAFAVGLCVAGVLLRQDPLQTLYEANSGVFIMLQLCIGIAYPAFLAIILLTVLRCRDRLDVFVFGCELLFYAVIGMNYRGRVWRPAMLGENIDCGPMMYVVYTMDFVAMMALTVASSRPTELSRFGGHDVEKGRGEETVEGSAVVNSVSKGIGSLGSGLVQLVVGGRRDEKAE
eukprot:TRINITY_DN606_c1_g1_i1.p2 TRINITY_DN606_c1_g1~~TRINITY_DN606_c1_g1_i1.p2  ORF type:complete len:615 (+),score=119.98 TRINITY_DN606_c1_g1_i1:10113-11957(+)